MEPDLAERTSNVKVEGDTRRRHDVVFVCYKFEAVELFI